MDQQSEFVSGGTEGAPDEKRDRRAARRFGDRPSKENWSRVWDELVAGGEKMGKSDKMRSCKWSVRWAVVGSRED